MKKLMLLIFAFVSLLVVVSLNSYHKNIKASVSTETTKNLNQVYHHDTMVNLVMVNKPVVIEKPITVENYFQFIDSLVKKI